VAARVLVRAPRPEEFLELERLAAGVGLPLNASAASARDDAVLLVAVDSGGSSGAGILVGFALLRLAGDEAELFDVGVRPEARRRGIGRALLDRILETAKQRGVVAAHLEVRRDNEAARASYAAVGFEEVGVRHRYYRDGEDAILARVCLSGRG